MDNLSSELIALIIQHVDRPDLWACTLVNQRFHALANPILWRHIDLDKKTNLLLRTLVHHPAYGDFIQKAQFNSDTLTDEDLSTLTGRTPHLTTLVLNWATLLTHASMAQLVVDCPQLVSLQLFSSRINTLEMLQGLNGLRQLELVLCHDLGPRLFGSLFPFLTTLRIQMCHDNQDTVNTTLAAIADLHRLTQLEMYEGNYDLGGCLKMTWPQLTCLQLHPCPHLTDAIAIAFIQRHPHLVKLVLSQAIFTDATLDAIATHLPAVLHLGILVNTNITAHGVRRLIQRCTDLGELDLTDSNISVDDFPEMKSIFGDPGYLYGLDRHDIATIRLNTVN